MKKKRKLKTAPVVFAFCFVILSILIFCMVDILREMKSPLKERKIIDEIPAYSYVLYENDSAYVASIFEKLKKELSSELIDEEKYASYVAQIFVADFYTLSTAINKNDVGGVSYVYKDYQDSFLKKAKNTVYRYVENNVYNNRKQELPTVKEVTITSIEEKMYNEEKVTDGKAYEIEVSVQYEKELGYPKEVSLILVHVEDQLAVAFMK